MQGILRCHYNLSYCSTEFFMYFGHESVVVHTGDKGPFMWSQDIISRYRLFAPHYNRIKLQLCLCVEPRFSIKLVYFQIDHGI
jgi:hypothetical protein